MNAIDCLLAKADAGIVDRDKVLEAASRFDELSGEIQRSTRRTKRDADRMAAVRLQKELTAKALRKKRMRLKQVQAIQRVQERAASAPEEVDQAMLSLLDFDPRQRVSGENVALMTEVIRGQAHALAADFLDKYRSKAAGLMRAKAGLENVVRELFGESTADGNAKALAGGVSEAFGMLRGRYNAAGGDIGFRKDWGLPQGHDRAAVASASKQEWVDFVRDRVDPSRMLDDEGQPITLRSLQGSLDTMYDDIVTGGLVDMVGPMPDAAKSSVFGRVHHRFLVFRDADSWLAYQKKFGTPDIFSTIIAHIDGLARDTAVMEVLGPYPGRTIEAMEGLIEQAEARGALSATGKKAAKALAKLGGAKVHLRDTYRTVTGELMRPSNSKVAHVSQANRNVLVSAMLGGAFFSSLSDLATQAIAARMVGIPARRVLGAHLKMFLPTSAVDRRTAVRAGFTAQGWASNAIAAQRLFGEVTGPEWSAKVTDTVLRASLLSPWTEAGKWAFQTEMLGFITENAGKRFGQLPDALKATFERNGINPPEWDLIRSTPQWTDIDSGATFIRAADVARHEAGLQAEGVGSRGKRFDAANLLQQAIFLETRFAIIESTARVRALMTAGKEAGSFAGEVWRNFALFKSFPVTAMHMHLSRGLSQQGWSRARYFAELMIATTAMGVLGDQLSEISKGKDPQDLTDPRVWAKGAARGGGFGMIGDFLFSDVNRYGGGMVTTLAGPVFAQGEDLVQLTVGNVQRLIAGDETKLGPDLSRFLKMNTPGRSLWYGRLAFERLIFDRLDELADPNASARFRRMEQRAQREFGQGYWAPPGKGIRRAPDLEGMAGQ